MGITQISTQPMGTMTVAPMGVTRLSTQPMGTLPSTLVHLAGRPLPRLSRAAWAP